MNTSASDLLEQGREAYRQRAWGRAFEALSQLDRAGALAADDLWLLSTSAFLIGRSDDFLGLLERCYRTYRDLGGRSQAVRCAFWLGSKLAERGDMGQATGWFARAQRLLEGERDSAEHGYLLLPLGQRQLAGGDLEAACAIGAAAAEIGVRFGDADLLSLALHLQGRARVRQGRVDEGMALLDEAMVAVTAGEVSPIMAGLVYCSVISACRQVYALQRAREWTAALSGWCEEQPDLVPYAGQCLAHRAEILRLRGDWHEAIDEASRVVEGPFRRVERQAVAAACYQRGEVERLRGAFEAAETAYREASHWGQEPQPGLAQLRLAQGKTEVAAAVMRRVLAEAADRLKRARLLPAAVEIALAVDALDEARAACDELTEIAGAFRTDMLATLADQARGAVELAAGDPGAALTSLRRAWTGWQTLGAPYETAHVRVLLGQTCRALGDDDTAALEFQTARSAFERLGAAPALARVEALIQQGVAPSPAAGLTRRELEVLRLVASGASNKAIAAQLAISDRTVERHVSNIFDKLAVSSRAAATAYAYRHDLL